MDIRDLIIAATGIGLVLYTTYLAMKKKPEEKPPEEKPPEEEEKPKPTPKPLPPKEEEIIRNLKIEVPRVYDVRKVYLPIKLTNPTNGDTWIRVRAVITKGSNMLRFKETSVYVRPNSSITVTLNPYVDPSRVFEERGYGYITVYIKNKVWRTMSKAIYVYVPPKPKPTPEVLTDIESLKRLRFSSPYTWNMISSPLYYKVRVYNPNSKPVMCKLVGYGLIPSKSGPMVYFRFREKTYRIPPGSSYIEFEIDTTKTKLHEFSRIRRGSKATLWIDIYTLQKGKVKREKLTIPKVIPPW